MTVKSIFDAGAKEEILQRLEKLTPASKAQWGKMNVSQMFAHCCEVLKLATTSKIFKLSFIGYFMQFFKSSLYNDKPFARNLPTAPNFKMVEEKEFEPEKIKLISLIHKLVENGESALENKVHPVFGKMTAKQWGISQWKHLNHHFEQFGV
jgi:hypothetical protein